MPIDLRALAPAPLATTSGATPRMKANDVIRIGRNQGIRNFTSVEAAPATTKDFFNDRHIKRYSGALGVAGDRDIRSGDAGIFASAH